LGRYSVTLKLKMDDEKGYNIDDINLFIELMPKSIVNNRNKKAVINDRKINDFPKPIRRN